MALENANSNYFKIGKVVGFNSIDASISVLIEEYESKEKRDNPTKYDNRLVHQVGVDLDQADIADFVTKLYAKIKLLEKYSTMTDVIE